MTVIQAAHIRGSPRYHLGFNASFGVTVIQARNMQSEAVGVGSFNASFGVTVIQAAQVFGQVARQHDVVSMPHSA